MAEQQPKSNKLIDTGDLMFIWRLFVKNLFLIILIPIITYLIGFVYTHRLTDIYGAKVQLLLKSSDTYNYQDQIYKGLGAYGVYMDVQNQMRILRSRDLIGEVIDKIDIGTSYYVVGRLKKQEVFETLPFRTEVTLFNEAAYEIPVTVFVLNEEEYRIEYTVGEQNKSFTQAFNKELQTEDFNLTLVQQYDFGEQNIETIMSSDYEMIFHSRNYLISKYQTALEINNVEFTSILDVSVKDELQMRAKVFLDTLTAVYVDFSKRIQLEVNQNTLTNIDKQIDTVGIFIRNKEQELLNYKNENAILDPTKEGDQYFAEYIKYSQEKRTLQSKMSSIIALKSYLKSSDDNRVLPPSFYIEANDFYLSQAISEVRSLQVSLEIKMTHATVENNTIKNLKKEIALKKQDIINYLGNLEKAVQKEMEITDQYIAKYRYNVKSIPLSEQGIINIQRELDVNNNMYLFLLEKKTNTLIARAGIIPQVRVLETPSILGAVQPDKKKLLRLFLLFGLVLGILVAAIRTIFFEKLVNVAELKQNTFLNVVGGIPRHKTMETGPVVLENPKSQITESFRTIRTNLSFMRGEKRKSQLILISSFFPGEGKTFCSTNLSALTAQSDKKTVLIDFDLHKPRVHKALGIENTTGISTYLIGKSSMEEILQKNVSDNLDVITAGPIAPNPSELILKSRVDELLEAMSREYEYVIIDTPPFGILNDTLELIKKVDTFLVVLNTKYTKRKGIRVMEEILSKYEQVSVGLILNDIRESKIKYYYAKYAYKYTYGYNYGYGYGYGKSYGQDYVEDNDE
ncbi:MAG: polysaccharide biosynthesis tyrosine autokinase [Crocinitomicaceae bacterium]